MSCDDVSLCVVAAEVEEEEEMEDGSKFEKGRIQVLQQERVYIQKKTFTKWCNSFLEKVRFSLCMFIPLNICYIIRCPNLIKYLLHCYHILLFHNLMLRYICIFHIK